MRWWALQAAIIRGDRDKETLARFSAATKDENPTVRTTAAEGLARNDETAPALQVFRELLRETEPNLGLFVARSLAVGLTDVRPIEREIRARRAALLAPPGSPRPWKDFTYSAFTCWALEWALIKSRLNQYGDFER
jgi:HEAT repeat protein